MCVCVSGNSRQRRAELILTGRTAEYIQQAAACLCYVRAFVRARTPRLMGRGALCFARSALCVRAELDFGM